MAQLTDEQTGKLVKEFESLLLERLIPSEIFSMTSMAGLNLRGRYNEIKTMQKNSTTKDAVERFLHILHNECTEKGKYKSFVSALEEYGYVWVPIFRGEWCPDEGDSALESYVELIRYKLNSVKPSDILVVLKRDGCLTADQCERILKEEQNSCCADAMISLLHELPRCKKSNRWVTYLLVALANTGYEHIVEDIIPDLHSSRKFDSIAPKVNRLISENSTGNSSGNLNAHGTEDEDMITEPMVDYQEDGDGELPFHGNPNAPGFSSGSGYPRSLQSRDSNAQDLSSSRGNSFGTGHSRRPTTPDEAPARKRLSPERATAVCPPYTRTPTQSQTSTQSRPLASLPLEPVTRAPGNEYQPAAKLNQARHASLGGRINEGSTSRHQADLHRDFPQFPESSSSRETVPPGAYNSPRRQHDDDASSVVSFGVLTVNDYNGEDRPAHTGGDHSPSHYSSCHEKPTLQVDERRQSPRAKTSNNVISSAGAGQVQARSNIGPEQDLQSDDDEADSFFRDEEDDSLSGETLELRKYQINLAKPALEGKNVILVAPTGTGKTYVAMHIIKNHLDKQREKAETGKVIVFAPTNPLVSQHRRVFEKYLTPDYNAGCFSGDRPPQVPMRDLLQRYDVFIMTPQILVDALEDDRLDGVTDFSMLVFDECHHSHKGHPYNTIMDRYFTEKDDYSIMPQILGLTASVGVGKAKNMARAVEHIIKLCANLDCKLNTIPEEDTADLQNFANNPDEEIMSVQGRTNDPFNQHIKLCMTRIEDSIQRDVIGKPEAIEVKSCMDDIPERGSQKYLQWKSKIKNAAARIHDGELRYSLISSLNHLEMYNNALMVNADCRTKDALDFMQKEMEKLSPQHYRPIDKQLFEFYRGMEPKLKEISSDPNNVNPKLRKLKEAIRKKYEEFESDARGIIFVKTREMTIALQNWMNEDEELGRNGLNLNATRLTGQAKADIGGMTQQKQDIALKDFKDGSHKFLIATTVAEEGLDIRACNIVIKYEHVTNETARIQARGRGRAEDSAYVVIAEQGTGITDKEEINKIRESMMKEAVRRITAMTEKDFNREFIRYQNECKAERKMASLKKETLKQQRLKQYREGEFILNCLKCNAFCCTSRDIKKVKNAHHVIVDPTFKERVNVVPHPKPRMYDEFNKTGKVYCIKCKHDWGIQAIYRNVKVFVTKISSFQVVDPYNKAETIRKWKDCPFSVKDFTELDLNTLAESLTN